MEDKRLNHMGSIGKASSERTIVLEDLAIGYREGRGSVRHIVPSISATIYGGELTSLLGANGVGKSTLLRTMTANQPALGGAIYYNGEALGSYSRRSLSKMISVVLTERVTIKNITVFELVGFGRSPYTGFWGDGSSEDRSVVVESLRLVGIAHLASRMVHTLSDGERQKAMIAKALAQQTPIILLDEPTAFLDFPSKVEIMQLLHRLSRVTGKTIFMSTHDLDLALQISDRVWLMDGDSGVHTGVPEDLALDGSLRSFFERKGIAYDAELGQFRVDNEVSVEVDFVAECGGARAAMVRKALLRCGVAARVGGAAECAGAGAGGGRYRVVVGEDRISVAFDGALVECANIEALLKIVVS